MLKRNRLQLNTLRPNAYLVAIFTAAVATILTFLIEGILAPTIMPLFFAAVAISSWYGGLKPGLLTAILSTLLLEYCFVLPRYVLDFPSLANGIRLTIFFLIAVIISLLSEDLQQAKQRLKQFSDRQVQNQKEQLQMALQAAHMGMWDWNLLTGTITWTSEHEALFGLTPGTFDGRYETFDACLHPDDRQELQQTIQKVIQDHQVYQHEYRVVWADRSVHWIEGRGQVFYDTANRPVRMIGTVMNIDSRKQIRATLEHQIAERTRELQQINDRLQQELYEREQMEQALRQSEERLQLALEGSGDGLWDWNIHTGEVYLSPRWLSMLGYDTNEPLGHVSTWVQLIHPDDQHWVMETLNAHLQDNSVPYRFDYRVLSQSGEWQWIANYGKVTVQDETGAPLRMTGTHRDVSDRKRTEQALQDSEARHRRIVQIANEGIWAIDTNSCTTFVNPKMAEMVGYRAEDMLGKPLFAFMDEEGQAIATAKLKHHCQEPAEQHDFKFQRRDGSVLWSILSMTPILDDAGQNVGALAMVTDISERKRIEDERKCTEAILQEKDRRWQSLLNDVQLLVVGLDQAGVIDYVNPFFLNVTGYAEADVLNKDWFNTFLPSYLRPQVRIAFQDILQHNSHSHYQNVILTKSREERVIAWNSTLLRDLQGHPIGTISIGEDITDRYKLERMKAEFIAIVSHELRTPLTSISGALELLSTGLLQPQSDRGQQTIQIAATEADRLTRLVNDILDLERLESGKVRLETQPCNLADLMIQAVDFMQLTAAQAHIALAVTPISQLLEVDSDRIHQVLTNLLSNAIKFSESGSTIWLLAEIREDGKIGRWEDEKPVLCPTASLPYLLITVRDQGRGIPPDSLEQIFERFHQVDASDSRKKGGTGLGLAICRSIVQQHGGKIWAESILGKGSCFNFTLPIKKG